jgi:hypothetical protein
MSNNSTGPLVLTTENDPSLWRTNSHRQRLQARRNAAATRKNRPSITNKIRGWFGKIPATTRHRRSRRNTPRIMYE